MQYVITLVYYFAILVYREKYRFVTLSLHHLIKNAPHYLKHKIQMINTPCKNDFKILQKNDLYTLKYIIINKLV